MTPASTVHLLVPGLLGPMPGFGQGTDELDLGTLARYLSRARGTVVPGQDLESTLCRLFGVQPEPDYPLAALCRLGSGAEPDTRFWLRADPVCLRADQTSLLLFDGQDFDISNEDAETLGKLFRDYFADSTQRLEIDTPNRWYWSPEQIPHIRTRHLCEVTGRDISAYLPGGEDALQWHRLSNEIQMLFFDSEANRQREAKGQMPISGLWFSGGGCLPASTTKRFDQVYTDGRLASGLARLAGIELSTLAGADWSTLARPGERLIVYPQLRRPVLRADPIDWLDELLGFQLWLNRLVTELSGACQVLLYPCNGQLYRLPRRASERFWRRTRAISHWLDRGS